MGAVVLSFSGESCCLGAARAPEGFREEGPRVGGEALQALRGSSLRDDFFAWRGASGRRYVCSVFPQEESEVVAQFERVMLIGVSRRGPERRVICVLSSSQLASRRPLGVDEWHVHFGDDDRKLRDLAAALLH